MTQSPQPEDVRRDPTGTQPTTGDPHEPDLRDRAASTLRRGQQGADRFADSAAAGARRVLTFAAFAAAAVVAVWIGWFLFGEWWISVVRDRVHGSVFAGWGFGWTVGFVATMAALLILRLVIVRRMWTWLRIVLATLAAVPLLPLAFSLRLWLNRVNDHKGSLEYQMLTDGRGYQSGVGLGIATAVILATALSYAAWSAGRARRRRKAARAERAAREAERR